TDKISSGIGKKVLGLVFEKDKDPEDIVKEMGLDEGPDESEIIKIVSDIVDANPKVADAVRDGAEKQIGFFMGQVMKATSGKANPGKIQKLLREKILAGP
ncbi:MAG: Asp-tRNA(Asn)/Glu-tRNA(Gln) amidotransferase GatCAB subunit B, partial [Spirochaetales bacterium]|nr:Asp-tRNA(Asn)/Glu-tRNA(Gln) amidotransferase GatCAB subunit B [Spirochaetales bacterium]